LYVYTYDELGGIVRRDSDQDVSHRGVARVAAILEAVRSAEAGLRLSDLAARLGAPKTSIRDLLRGLVDVGYLTERDGAYRVGPGLAVLLGRTGPQLVVEVAHPALEELTRETGETAMLGLRVGGDIVYIDQVEAPQTVRYSAPLHVRRPLLHTSMGKIHLAYLDPSARERLLRASLTDDAHTTALHDLAGQLQEVRSSGVAYNRGESGQRAGSSRRSALPAPPSGWRRRWGRSLGRSQREPRR
jgi:DNA-binding IclR family transcriptional regulator